MLQSALPIAELLRQLVDRGVRLAVEGERLRVQAPPGVLTAEDRVGLAARKAEILAQLQVPVAVQRPISVCDRSLPYPPTPAQERMWMLERIAGDAAVLIMSQGLRLIGELDRAALRAAMDAVIARHDALRTVIATDDAGVLHGLVLEPAPCPWIEADLADLPGPIRQTRITADLAEEATAPFDLSRPPLIRSRLLCLGAREHLLIVSLHHLAGDGWSVRLILEDLATAYAGRPLAPPAITHADYAHHLAAQVGTEAWHADEAYWKNTLAGARGRIDLPWDRPSGSGSEAGLIEVPIAGAALAAAAARWGVTPFVVHLAAWAATLARLSQERDLVIGTLTAGRGHPQIQDLVGCCVNTLGLRLDLAQAGSGADLIALVRRVVNEAMAHQDLPFEAVQRLWRPDDGGLSVLCDHDNADAGALADVRLGELRLDPVPALRLRTPADLRLTLTADLRVECVYRQALLDEATARRWTELYARLLAGLIREPQRSWQALDWLDQAQRRQVVEDFNATVRDYDLDTCLHSFIAAQAGRTPEAIAVQDATRSLTYAQLEAESCRLAQHLRRLGAGPDRLVAVMISRSCELEIALLAVLKSGAAYVPLDPSYPEERLCFMLEDSAPAALLVLGASPLAPACPVIDLVADRPAWADLPATTPASSVGPQHLAYMIYTSGSTGRPKGAMNEHRAIVNRLRWMQEAYRLTPDDRVLQKTPASFDVSVWEFFWPLMYGATLVFAKPEGHKDPEYLADLIARERITTIHFVPSMLAAFLEADDLTARCASLRTIVCSGEALPHPLTRRCLDLLPQAGLHNLYGPTECAVDVTAWTCRADDPRPLVPIGFPIANTRMYVLDAARQPQPIGVPGDLFIAGIQVGRGYHRREELTRERFLDDPFVPGGRMYLTGDRARWLTDGSLDYLGRSDFQVKLRGQRIELGEIEAALLRQPGVAAAAVMVREDRPGDQRLVAYVVASGSPAPETQVLIEGLARLLPTHMIPAVFVALDALPLSPSGKCDRRRLPAPQAAASSQEPPRPGHETALATYWRELLRIDAVGRADDFFRLGGHSLLAVRLASLIRSRLGVTVPVAAIFAHPVLADLAQVLADSRYEVIEALPADAPPQAGPAAQWMQRLQAIAGDSTYTLAYPLAIHGPLDARRLAAAWMQLVRRHEVLTLRLHDDGRVGRWPAEALALDSGAWDASFTQRPIVLDREPAVRLRLELGEASRPHRLALVAHHAVIDGYALARLAHELVQAYAGEALPPLEISYGALAAWQHRQLAGPSGEALAQAWRRHLDALPGWSMPAGSGPGRLRVTWDATALARIQALAQGCEATPSEVLTAAWAAVLGRWAGWDRGGLVGVLAGRDHPQAAEVVGCLVNTVVLPFDLRQPTADGLTRQASQAWRFAHTHGLLPYDRILEAAGLDPRGLGALLVVQELPPQHLELPGCRVELLPHQSAGLEAPLILEVVRQSEALHWDLRSDRLGSAELSELLAQVQAWIADPMAWSAPLRLQGQSLPPLSGLLELVARQVRARPDHPALIAEDRTLSYTALWQASGRLATALAATGCRAGEAVALTAGRNPEFVIGVLGILRAGGCYTPWDDALPAAQRQARRDCLGLRLCVDEAGAAEGLRRVRSAVSGDLCRRRHPLQPCYAMFTSGSTGEPKGVLIPDQGVERLILGAGLPTGADRRWLMAAPTGFDASTLELWSALAHGSTLVLAPEGPLEPAALEALIRRHGVDTAFLTAGLLAALADTRPTLLHALKAVVSGGDVVPPRAARLVLAHGGRFINAYGPTETSVCVATHEITAADLNLPDLPLGRVVAGDRVMLVDRRLQDVAPGCSGELLAGGVGLAQGYAAAPRLSAERFIPGPQGERWYRTGDRCRCDAQNRLRFEGRLDRQLKVRGHRVEAAAVEHQLGCQDGISAAVVGKRGDALVAWVVATVPVQVQTLRRQLAGLLPASAVPSAIVVVERLPLTANGKIDRAALPDPVAQVGDPPHPGLETDLAALWKELLPGHPTLYRDSDFIALGGSSLAAIRLATRCQDRLGRSLTVRSILVRTRLDEQAAALEQPVHLPTPIADRSQLIRAACAAERMVLLERLGQGAAYRLGSILAFAAPLDAVALRGALEHLITRHEGLRTTFSSTDDTVQLHIHPELPLRWTLEDAIDSASAQAAAERFLAGPLDLERGPLVAAGMWRIPGGSVLALGSHHAVVDGWSLGQVIEELGVAYRALAVGQVPQLPPVILHAADLAAYDHHQDLTAALNFWRERIQVGPLGELPAATPDAGAATWTQTLDPDLIQQVRRTAAGLGTTSAALVQAVFGVLLSRLMGPSCVFGLVSAGREHSEAARVVAMRVAVLPQRVEVRPITTWRDLVRHAAQTTAEAQAHAAAAWPAIDASGQQRSRLTEVLFTWNADLEADLPDFGVPVKLLPQSAAAQCRLGLTISGQDWQAQWESEGFPQSSRQAWSAHFLEMLVDCVRDPAARVLPTLLPDPPDMPVIVDTVLERFLAQAQRQPQALAGIDHDGAAWTYDQLRQRTLAWACHLGQRLGQRFGQRVGLIAPRSLDRVAALLGIWHSGAAAVPVDPAHGRERVDAILAQAQVAAVLDASHLAAGPDGVGALPVPTSALDPAYLIFTSGSTGTPKGVVIAQRSLIGHLDQWNAALGLNAGDRLLHVSGVGFDGHLEEILAPLICGGAIVVAGQALPEPCDLARLCREHGITVLNPVVSIGQAWSEDPAALPIPPSVRILALGSEALGGPVLSRLARPGLALFNTYGPTECTITPTLHRCADADLAAACVPIGRPLPDRGAFVADRFGLPLPAGLPGELRLTGPELAWGYWNDVRKTAAAFLPAPGGGRQYRTGDRVVQDADGVLHFLGRGDRQVKINGVRIELAEIEAALASHPAVVQAAADVRQGRLVAWVHLRWATAGSDLLNHAASRLPRAALPGALTVVDLWPLNANGKLDRSALPDPEAESGEPPRPGAEQDLAAIWRDLLPGAAIHRHSDLFALGGTSLTAIRLIGRIRQTFGRDLPISALLGASTLETLAARLAQDDARWSPLVPLHRSGTKPPIHLFPGAGGAPFYLHPLVQALGEDQPVVALQARGLDGQAPPFATVQAAAEAYAEAIAAEKPEHPLILAGHSFGAQTAYATAQILARQGFPIAQVFIIDGDFDTDDTPSSAPVTITDLVEVIEGWAGQRLNLDRSKIEQLDPETQIAAVHAALISTGILPPETTPAQVRGLAAVFAADHAARWRPDSAPRLPITLIQAGDPGDGIDPVVHGAQQDRIAAAWAQQAMLCARHQVAGDHLAMMNQPLVAAVARILSA